MKNEKFNQVIDEVYNHYLETHKDEPFILQLILPAVDVVFVVGLSSAQLLKNNEPATAVINKICLNAFIVCFLYTKI